MDPREHWEALQSSLREARNAIAAGDRLRALEAVDLALTLDPQFLAAQSLRNRLVASVDPPSMAVQGAPDSNEKPAPVRTPMVTGQFAQFEERARNRRLQRRLAAARDAIAHSRFDQASAAVEELRELDPQLPDLPALSNAITRGETFRRSRRGGLWLVAAVATAGLTLAAWSFVRNAEPGTGSLPSAEPPGAAQHESAESAVAAPTPLASAGADTSAVTSAEGLPGTSPTSGEGGTRDLRVSPGSRDGAGQRAAADLPRAVAPAPQPVTREAPGPTPAVISPPPNPQRIETEPPPPLIQSEPRVTAAPTPARASGPPGDVASPPDTRPAPTSSISDEQLVEVALQRYRRAYEGLDAASAHAVWPTVDQAALARAFDGLSSQSLTFQGCDVQVDGGAARAICGGAVRYVPKVGSREPRTEPRRWTFSLIKRGADWQIENVRADR